MKKVLILVLLLMAVVTLILLSSLLIVIHTDTTVSLQGSPLEKSIVNSQLEVDKAEILSNESINQSPLIDDLYDSENNTQRVSDSSKRASSSSKSTQRSPKKTNLPSQEESVLPKLNTEPEFTLFALQIHDTHGTDWFANITSGATIIVDKDGLWSQIVNPQLTENSVVFIPKGITIEYDSYDEQAFNALAIQGELIFDPTKDTKMSVKTIAVYDHGRLDIHPQNRDVTTQIHFVGEVNPETDESQTTLGLFSACNKKCVVNIEGTSVTPTYVAVNAQKESNTIVVSQQVNWREGDKLVLADSQTPTSTQDPSHYTYMFEGHDFPQQTEIVTITNIQGNTITIDRELAYDHVNYMAHITRNIILSSDNPRTILKRGHVMFAGNTEATISNTAFVNLGRTTIDDTDDTHFTENGEVTHQGQNQRARYSLHTHHLQNPFLFEGNAIINSPKWGIVNHNSFGTIEDNVVIGAHGAGIVTENGLETGKIHNNIVIGMGGGSGLLDDERFATSEGLDLGHGGFGYWFRGPFVEVTDNVAAGYFSLSGYGYFLHPKFAKETLPNIQGMPSDLAGKSQTDLVAQNPLRRFSGNIADGVFAFSGFNLEYSTPDHVIEDLTVISRGNSSNYAVSAIHTSNITIQDSYLIGTSGGSRESSPFYTNQVGSFEVKNTHIGGFTKEYIIS